MSYEEYGYDKLFRETGEFICSNTENLPNYQRELFQEQFIFATIQYAMYDNGEFCDFVGFELMYTHILDLEIREQYKSIFDRNAIISNLKKGINSNSIIHPQDTFDVWLESGYIAMENPNSGDIEAYCYAKDIPIIAMSANAYEEDIQKSRDVGMNEHLAKPVNPKKLYATLAKFLK